VRSFNRVEIQGRSRETFSFLIEYKVQTHEGPRIVQTAGPRSFFASLDPHIVSVPIVYDGTVNELVMSFVQKGESSDLILSSIGLGE
jgi:hypothetical protein